MNSVRKLMWQSKNMLGFPGGSVVKYPPASVADAGDVGLISRSGRSLGGENGNPLQYSCQRISHGQRNLVGYRSWNHRESNVTEHTSVSHSVLSDSLQLMDCSPPGSSVHGILQARILEWVAIHFSRWLSMHTLPFEVFLWYLLFVWPYC